MYLRPYQLFISHAWRYNDDYHRLINLLNDAPFFSYRNFSVPTHDPLAPPGAPISDRRLFELLSAQIRPVQCVLVIAGMYAAHRYWMEKEIAIAQFYGKPIIGLIPHGQKRLPLGVLAAADEQVHWSTESIVRAIRTRSMRPQAA